MKPIDTGPPPEKVNAPGTSRRVQQNAKEPIHPKVGIRRLGRKQTLQKVRQFLDELHRRRG